ncbi:putative AraC family transcriptional regulator [Paenibacillus agaridevorans]|uniref:Putative AraC family transcriptional regulator n=2 Tax=Paenibacillus agaridevorans TaxID=171404 RepID=A0A2R5EQ88_9BACL|nr:putative AraC family transcriptional regulator [Paenibacillus agaridevorans]
MLSFQAGNGYNQAGDASMGTHNQITYIQDDLRISLDEFAVSGSMASIHAHNTYEIYYLYAGERFLYLNQTTYHLKKGDLVLINAYDRHRTIAASVNEHQRFLVMLNEQSLQLLPLTEIDAAELFHRGSSVLRLSREEQAAVEHLLFRLLQERKSGQPGCRNMMQALVTELMITLFRHQPAADNRMLAFHDRAAEMMKYLNAHYRRSITIMELSERFALSRFHLSRLFKSATGFTVIDYIHHVRLLEARQLLRSTSHSVSSIADMLGFGSLAHFERMFKRSTGTSPTLFRKLLSESKGDFRRKEDD